MSSLFKKLISSSSELLSNYSLFGDQLKRRSNQEPVALVIYLGTTDQQTVKTIHALELI